MPPTFPGKEKGSFLYVLEERRVPGRDESRKDVLLDSVPSQANRAEAALLRAHREGRIELPLMKIVHDGEASVRLTSLEWPHRYADAYLIDSKIDGTSFDKSVLGKAFQAANAENASVLLRHDPGSLVFGAWNSHRKGRQVKFPRIYSSEIIGWDPQEGKRRGGRMDPLNLTGIGSRSEDGELNYAPGGKKTKGQELSEIGHGSIPPNPAPGGVTVSSAERTATLSLAGLDRIGFGASPGPIAARAFLAAYALVADRLAFGGPSLWLRSGCELVTVTEDIEWVLRGGGTQPVDLTVAGAVELYGQAVAAVAEADPELALVMETVKLAPGEGLKAAIDFALTKSAPASLDEASSDSAEE